MAISPEDRERLAHHFRWNGNNTTPSGPRFCKDRREAEHYLELAETCLDITGSIQHALGVRQLRRALGKGPPEPTIQELNQRFNETGNIRDAVRLRQAQRKVR